MRIGIGLMVALMVVMGSLAQADVIAFRTGGDNSGASVLVYGGNTYQQSDGTMVNLAFDDTLVGGNSTAASNNSASSTLTTRNDGGGTSPIIGFAGVFEQLPSGATITSAKVLLTLKTNTNAYYDLAFTFRRVTTDWLLGNPGTNEANITSQFKDVATSTDWAGNVGVAAASAVKFSNLNNATATNLVVFEATEGPADTLQAVDLTAIIQDMYAASQDYGIVFSRTAGKLISNDDGISGSTQIAFHSSEASLSTIAFRPTILLEYTTVPEPGTMLLVGSGVLGLVGVIRRRRMA